MFALQSNIVPFFKLPAALIFLLFSNASLWAFLFLRNVACRTCLLPHLGWEWLGVLRGNQHVIAAEARVRTEFYSSRTLRSCHKVSFWRQVDTPEFIPTWLIMDEAPIGHPRPLPLWLWLTCMWTHGRRCANTCTPQGRRRAALLHAGATVEGQVCSLIFFILDDVLSCSSGSRR